MKKILYLLLIAVVGMTTACVQDEKNVFDQSAAIRLSEAMAKYRTQLTEAPNGWIIDYYEYNNSAKVPSAGYAMYWKFNGPEVSIACEIQTKSVSPILITPAATFAAPSLWDIVPDQGPVLSFNLYNPILGHFCDAKQGDLVGLGGDFEFVFTGETDDHNLLLKGKRRDLIMTLRPLATGEDGIDYLQQTAAFADKVKGAVKFDFLKNGESVASAQIQAPRVFNFTYKTTEDKSVTISTAFAYTPTGIRLYEPVTVLESTFSAFVWDDATETYTATDAGVNVVLANIPAIPITPGNVSTYPPNPEEDAVSNLRDLKNSGGTVSQFILTARSSKLDAWLTAYAAAVPEFENFTVQLPRSSYDISFNANYSTGGKWYLGPPSGTTGYVPMTDPGHNPFYEVAFNTCTRSSTTSPLPTNYNASGNGVTSLRTFLQQATGFTVLQDGNSFWLRSNADPNDWFKLEPF